jgi:hypothetical protein
MELIDGPDTERNGMADGFSCRLQGIPTKRCPAGCPGLYWYWPDFGVEVLDALTPESENIARRKIGLFKQTMKCKTCDVDLLKLPQPETFVFRPMLRKGTPLEITITAPALQCPSCQKAYLPANTSTWDPYYQKLCDLVSSLVTTDLIR